MPNPVIHASCLSNRAEEYDHEGASECAPRAQASAVEQGKADRGKAAAATQARLVDPDKAPNRRPRSRPRHVEDSAIDSKLRGCDVVAIRVEDVAAGGYTADRATVRQKKTGRPVRFELSEQTRQAVDDYLKVTGKRPGEFLFTGRGNANASMTTRQYARLVSEWIGSVGLDPRLFGTHSLRRTKATLIYRRTGNLRAVQLLLGHTKLAPLDLTPAKLALQADSADMKASKAGIPQSTDIARPAQLVRSVPLSSRRSPFMRARGRQEHLSEPLKFAI